jgi:hypothetical protein
MDTTTDAYREVLLKTRSFRTAATYTRVAGDFLDHASLDTPSRRDVEALSHKAFLCDTYYNQTSCVNA